MPCKAPTFWKILLHDDKLIAGLDYQLLKFDFALEVIKCSRDLPAKFKDLLPLASFARFAIQSETHLTPALNVPSMRWMR